MAKKLIAWVSVLAMVVVACGPGATPTPTPAPAPKATPTAVPTRAPAAATPAGPQELVYAIATFSEETLDPTISSISSAFEITGPLWDWPVELTPQGELKPLYAVAWEQSADGLSWTLKLKQGIKFHDGQEMTAEDVKFSIEAVYRTGARASRTAMFRARIKSIEVVDRNTVRINTHKPWATFMYDMSTQAGSESAVLPKHYIERVGWTEFNSKPMGTGPGKFAQHRAGNFVEYAANKDYWLYTPQFDRFRYIVIPELSTRIAMLRMGQADIVKATLATLPEIEKAGLRTIGDPQPTSVRLHLYGTYRPEAGPLGNLKVRQALNLAVNRQEMVDTIFYGRGKPAAVFPIGEISLGFPVDLKPYSYDSAKAKQLLAEAGHARGLTVTLFSLATGGFTQNREVAEAVAGYWRQVGVEARIVPTDLASIRPRYLAKPQSPELIGAASTWGGTARIVGADDLSIWWSQSANITKLADNIDPSIQRGLDAPTVAEMAKAVQEAYRTLYNEFRGIPLADVYSEVWGISKRVGEMKVRAQRGFLGASIPSASLAR